MNSKYVIQCTRNVINSMANNAIDFVCSMATARGKAELSDIAADHAREDYDIAKLTAKQFAPDFIQPGGFHRRRETLYNIITRVIIPVWPCKYPSRLNSIFSRLRIYPIYPTLFFGFSSPCLTSQTHK